MSRGDDGVQARLQPLPALQCRASIPAPAVGNLPQTLPWGTGLTAEKLQKQAAS